MSEFHCPVCSSRKRSLPSSADPAVRTCHEVIGLNGNKHYCGTRFRIHEVDGVINTSIEPVARIVPGYRGGYHL